MRHSSGKDDEAYDRSGIPRMSGASEVETQQEHNGATGRRWPQRPKSHPDRS